MMKRAIAKISFNYLAHQLGAEFAALPAFDPIRRFVRYGDDPPRIPVISTFDLPFRTNRQDDQRPVVHFINLSTHEAHRNLLGGVMLFGFMNHTIMLAENFTGPWPYLPVAHVYNVSTLETSPVPTSRPQWKHESED